MDYLPGYESDQEGPVITEGIVGFRIFRIISNNENQDDLVLKSLAIDSYWQPGLNQAVCRSSGQKAPENNCHCGFNAYYNLGDKFLVNSDFFQYFAIAAIIGGGTVRMHRDGFRAEKAAVLGLLHSPFLAGEGGIKIQTRLADIYKTPLYDNRADLIKNVRESGIIINSAKEIVDVYWQEEDLADNYPKLGVKNEIETMYSYSPINFYYEFLNENKPLNHLPKHEQALRDRVLEMINADLKDRAFIVKFLAEKNRGPLALAIISSLILFFISLALFNFDQGIINNPDQGPLNLIAMFLILLVIPMVFIFILEKGESFFKKIILRSIKDKVLV